MGGDLRKVGWWMWRCGSAAWVFVALAALPAAAEPQSLALDAARAEAAFAERELDATRTRARALTERALHPDEDFQRVEQEIADTRTRLAAAERNLQEKSLRLVALEALAEGAAERQRLRAVFAARTRALEETKSRAAKTRASIRHAKAERRRLTARVGALEHQLAAKRRHQPSTRNRDDRQARRNRSPR